MSVHVKWLQNVPWGVKNVLSIDDREAEASGFALGPIFIFSRQVTRVSDITVNSITYFFFFPPDYELEKTCLIYLSVPGT